MKQITWSRLISFILCGCLLAVFGGASVSGAAVSDDFILGHLPEVLDVEPEAAMDFIHRNGTAELDLDGTGLHDYLAIYYTNGSSGLVKLFKLEAQGYQLKWQYPEGDGLLLQGLASTMVEGVDIDGDGKPELHLSGSNGKSEVHYLFKWDGAKASMISPATEKYPGGLIIGSAFTGSALQFVDVNRDRMLDTVVTQGIYEGRAMAEGPGALVDTLYVYGAAGFSPVESKRYSDANNPGSDSFGFLLRFMTGETQPVYWKQGWFAGNYGAENNIDFLVSDIEAKYALGDVDLDSFRIGERILPEMVRLKYKLDANKNQKEYLEVRYNIVALKEYAQKFWESKGIKTNQVCFDLSGKIRNTTVIVTRYQCLDVR